MASSWSTASSKQREMEVGSERLRGIKGPPVRMHSSAGMAGELYGSLPIDLGDSRHYHKWS